MADISNTFADGCKLGSMQERADRSNLKVSPLAVAVVVVGLLALGLEVQVSPRGRPLLSSMFDSINLIFAALFQHSFIVALVQSTTAALVILALGSAWRHIPRSIDLVRAKRFWGKGLSGSGIALCCGSLTTAAPPNNERYSKVFRDGRRLTINGPSEGIIGICEVRASSHIINALSRFREQPLPIEDDRTCLQKLNRSIVSIGSAASNEITEIIQADIRNDYLGIEVGNGGTTIRCRRTGSTVDFGPSTVRRDYGIILKISNVRFPGQFFFVCAGLGEWGTSGAAWYLANHWHELEALGQEFGCVLEVEIGSDQSAQMVYDPQVAEVQARIRSRGQNKPEVAEG